MILENEDISQSGREITRSPDRCKRHHPGCTGERGVDTTALGRIFVDRNKSASDCQDNGVRPVVGV
jgi:hypothetical protein